MLLMLLLVLRYRLATTASTFANDVKCYKEISVRIYIHAHIYTCICICICMTVDICIHIYIYASIVAVVHWRNWIAASLAFPLL